MTSQQFQAAMEQGFAAHTARQFEQALGHYQAALKVAPDNPQAVSFAGLALTHMGRLAEAEPLLRAAVDAAPDEFPFRFNLIEWLQAQGRYDEAVAEIQKIIDRDPRHALAWERLGDIGVAQQKLEGASRAYARALTSGEASFSAAMKQARVLGALGNFSGAMTALRIAAGLQPNDEGIVMLHAELLVAQRSWKELAELGEEWVKARPENPLAWRNLATAAFEQGRFRRAADATAKMIELAPGNAQDMAAYAQICLQAGDVEMAAHAFDEAELQDPNMPDTLAGKARLLTFQGKFDEAESYCRRALAQEPQRADAYWTLALLKGGKLEEGDIAALKTLSKDTTLWPATRAMAGFALGHGLEARDDHEAAFAAYEDAHAVKRESAKAEGIHYDAARNETHFDNLTRIFAHVPTASAPRHDGPRPIFVLGMPRSGTSLIETMLSAHSRVHGCGERPRMQQILAHYLGHMQINGARDPDADTLRKWAEAYYEDVRDIGSADHTVDKYPLNLEAAGLIARLFPNAVIIHTRRNPLETGLSIWRHDFAKSWSFANQLEDIGHYYGQYAQLMDHWERVLGSRFITVQYEDFAANFDTAAPKLVQACGLDWEEACANFQTASQPITTLSAVQVRDAVTPAKPRAQHYADQLAPLAEALRKANIDLETGAWRG